MGKYDILLSLTRQGGFQIFLSVLIYAGIVNVNKVPRAQGLKAHSLSPLSASVQEAQSADGIHLSDAARKASLIEAMVRVTPGDEATAKMIEVLSMLPSEALERMSQYGTRFEIHDKNAESLPYYARLLTKPHQAGAYSPTANVVVADQNNITPRILVHEAMHALDMALG